MLPYLQSLSADAGPVLVPFLEELGYHTEAFWEDFPMEYAMNMMESDGSGQRDLSSRETFGYYWMARQKSGIENLGIRTFNLSRFLTMRSLSR